MQLGEEATLRLNNRLTLKIIPQLRLKHQERKFKLRFIELFIQQTYRCHSVNVCVCVCLYTQYRFFVRANNIPEVKVSAELNLHVCFCTFAIVSLCSPLSLSPWSRAKKKTLCWDIFHASPFPSDPHWMSPTHTNYSQSFIRNSYSLNHYTIFGCFLFDQWSRQALSHFH